MRRLVLAIGAQILIVASLATISRAQTPLTWQEVKDRFEAANPTLAAGRIGIAESRAEETTAFLRPNPNLTGSIDQIDFFSDNPNSYRPFAFAFPSASIDYLHERRHKRELRLQSAQQETAITESQLSDQERTLLFNLRSAFIQTLQAKAVIELARANLEYFDRELSIHRERFKAGDISQLDLGRLELQRVQYESDYETAQVNLRTAKITLLTLLNDRTPVDRFEVTGPFTFADQVPPLQDFRDIGIQSRPDLKQPCRLPRRPGSTISWPSQTARPIRPSRSILLAIPRSRFTWDLASQFHCASLTAIRAKKSGPGWTSGTPSVPRRPRWRRSSAT
jgi:cobalt-zinc-cadmium efflux system outer membrane protein